MTPSDEIKAQVRTLTNSDHFHMLLLEGRPGLGKTTQVTKALAELGIDPAILGSYSTPLGLYNFLFSNRSRLVLIDDTSAVFNSPQAMALLKAATWDIPGRGRYLKWTSTTERADVEEFTFTGKLAVIVNSFPRNFDAEAVRNRSLELEINPGVSETKALLKEAAKDVGRFPNQKIVKSVLKKIVDNLREENLAKVSYRTLQKAYEVAVHNPDSFQKMAHKVCALPQADSEKPHEVIADLHRSKLKVKDQLREFERLTGFKRRSFFKYRKQLGIIDEG